MTQQYTVQAHIDGTWQCPGDQTDEWTTETLDKARELVAHAVSELGFDARRLRIVDADGLTVEGDSSDNNVDAETSDYSLWIHAVGVPADNDDEDEEVEEFDAESLAAAVEYAESVASMSGFGYYYITTARDRHATKTWLLQTPDQWNQDTWQQWQRDQFAAMERGEEYDAGN